MRGGWREGGVYVCGVGGWGGGGGGGGRSRQMGGVVVVVHNTISCPLSIQSDKIQ